MTFPPLLEHLQDHEVFNSFTIKRYMRDRYHNRTMLRTTNDIIMSFYLSFFKYIAHLCREIEKFPVFTLKWVSKKLL